MSGRRRTWIDRTRIAPPRSSLCPIRRRPQNSTRRGSYNNTRSRVPRIRIRSSRIPRPLNHAALHPALKLPVALVLLIRPNLSLRPGLLSRSLNPCPSRSPWRGSRVPTTTRVTRTPAVLSARPGRRGAAKTQSNQRRKSRTAHPLRIVSSPAHVVQLPLPPTQKSGPINLRCYCLSSTSTPIDPAVARCCPAFANRALLQSAVA